MAGAWRRISPTQRDTRPILRGRRQWSRLPACCCSAAAWRGAKTKVEWFDTIEGGPGYRIRKLRYEALERPDLYEDDPNLAVRVAFDKDARTITVQPWGEYASVRLAPERRWYVTNSFNF